MRRDSLKGRQRSEKAGNMSELQNVSASSSSRGVDYVRLCEDIVQRMEGVLNREMILNGRQCKSLAIYLSRVVVWVREMVEYNVSQKPALAPALTALYRYYESLAEILVRQCGEEDWCAAAVFQLSNDMSIAHIAGCTKFVVTYGALLLEGRCSIDIRKDDGEIQRGIS